MSDEVNGEFFKCFLTMLTPQPPVGVQHPPTHEEGEATQFVFLLFNVEGDEAQTRHVHLGAAPSTESSPSL